MAPFATSTALALATGCETLVPYGPPAPGAPDALTACICLTEAGASEVTLARYPMDLQLEEGQIAFAGVPLDARVGSNPYLYLKFTDGRGGELSDELFLGRCTRGLVVASKLFQQALAFANVGVRGNSLHSAPADVRNVLTLRGLQAAFLFRDGPQGSHRVESTHEVSIIEDGSKIHLPEPIPGTRENIAQTLTLHLMHGRTGIGKPILLGPLRGSAQVLRMFQA